MNIKNEVVRGQVDLPKVFERMKLAGGYTYDNELAAALGIKPQAFFNSRTRGSISLTLLVGAAEMLGVSLDYLVWGKGEEGASDDAYIEIEDVGGGKVKILAKLLRHGFDNSTARAFVSGDHLYIIDTADLILADGLYAFGRLESPAIRQCQLEVDGTIILEGKKEPQPPEKLAVGVLGKVIWHGSGC